MPNRKSVEYNTYSLKGAKGKRIHASYYFKGLGFAYKILKYYGIALSPYFVYRIKIIIAECYKSLTRYCAVLIFYKNT